MAARKPRSTLLNHSFPPFYACYLLKSVQKPTSSATYIGSTPNPPRRIRQHNGELTQGASKTKAQRPWVMQMIVHGFPSKLAALQFEWAWQHPTMSRHLRGANDLAAFATGNRRPRHLNGNIGVLRVMLTTHPYNNWPLRVTLFTEEAVKGWRNANKKAVAPLPPGLTCQIELEGVDGKSDHLGSGRQGPIDVTDEKFTTAYLSKHTAILASKRTIMCSICDKPVTDYLADPLSTALCPTLSCTSVAHLLCLANYFIQAQNTQDNLSLMPRGGECKSCRQYVLWGDVIRGCYRRSSDGVASQADLYDDDDDDDIYREESEEVEIIDELDQVASPPRRRSTTKSKSTKPTGIKAKKATRAAQADKESSGEFFDLDEVSSSGDDGQLRPPVSKASPRRGRPPKPLVSVDAAGAMSPRQPEVTEKQKQKPIARKPGRPRSVVAHRRGESDGEWFDLNAISSSSDKDVDNAQKHKISLATATAVPSRPGKEKILDARAQARLDSIVQQQPTANAKPAKKAKRRALKPAKEAAAPVSLLPGKGQQALALWDEEVDYFLDSDSNTSNGHQVLPDSKTQNPDLLSNAMSLVSLKSPSLSTGANVRKGISMETIEISD